MRGSGHMEEEEEEEGSCTDKGPEEGSRYGGEEEEVTMD